MRLHKRRTTLPNTTKVAVLLAINIQVQKDKELRLFTIPLLVLTQLLFCYWRVNQKIIGWQLKVDDIARSVIELVEAFGMASMVFWNIFGIISKSLWYGITPTWAN